MNYGDWRKITDRHGVHSAPLLYRGPHDERIAYELAEQDSSWSGSNHMSEGVVIVPEAERVDARVGRVCLKMVLNRYLEKQK